MIIIGIFVVITVVVGTLTRAIAAGVAVGLAATVLYYLADVKRNPRVACRWPGCKGSGGNYSLIGRNGESGMFRNPFGDCWCCGGRKSHPRLALKFISPEEYRRIKGEVSKGRKAIKR
jgi:hypothetical protein